MRSTHAFLSGRACLVLFTLGSMASCKSATPEGSGTNAGAAAVDSGGVSVAQPAAPAAAAPAAPAIAAAQGLPAALAAERAASCASLCKKTEPLKCPAQDKCNATCLESFNLPICIAEMGQFLACTSQSELANFVCDPDSGNPMLKDGYCDPEQGAVVNCLGTALQLQATP